MIAITGAPLEALDQVWLAQWNTAAERSQAQAYQQERALQFLAGRALSRWLAVTVFKVDRTAVTITRRSSGAPVLSCEGEVCSISISHCSGYICTAVAKQGPIGLDVEAATREIPRSVVTKFQQGIFAEARPTELLKRWLLAEAVTKAREGKLLTTLRESAAELSHSASYFGQDNFTVCCYAPNQQNSPVWIDFKQQTDLS
ncbi:4'-phosphopantetheinyl transferase family protein [Pseudidiomarina taiwanensis]|uniref:Uncharacterized protein n=1 Tax=Pseudidiomarina taiwanensis TaxID=337250 RepID=A0A432ZEL8_9GAMM|nr:hypothetical protein [Pseudidiomarina taiwanensis]RUO76371.1 hypothetical protein CWI83_08390 [Pseudidiomarina taiwanensis]